MFNENRYPGVLETDRAQLNRGLLHLIDFRFSLWLGIRNTVCVQSKIDYK